MTAIAVFVTRTPRDVRSPVRRCDRGRAWSARLRTIRPLNVPDRIGHDETADGHLHGFRRMRRRASTCPAPTASARCGSMAMVIKSLEPWTRAVTMVPIFRNPDRRRRVSADLSAIFFRVTERHRTAAPARGSSENAESGTNSGPSAFIDAAPTPPARRRGRSPGGWCPRLAACVAGSARPDLRLQLSSLGSFCGSLCQRNTLIHSIPRIGRGLRGHAHYFRGIVITSPRLRSDRRREPRGTRVRRADAWRTAERARPPCRPGRGPGLTGAGAASRTCSAGSPMAVLIL